MSVREKTAGLRLGKYGREQEALFQKALKEHGAEVQKSSGTAVRNTGQTSRGAVLVPVLARRYIDGSAE
jgi:hypothetical protein